MNLDLFNGYFWYQDKLYKDLPKDFFPQEYNPEIYSSILKELNGCFRIVVNSDNYIFAAVDRIRSLPLFFCQKGKELFISTDAFLRLLFRSAPSLYTAPMDLVRTACRPSYADASAMPSYGLRKREGRAVHPHR